MLNHDKLIPRTEALKFLWDSGKEQGLQKPQLEILEKYFEAIPRDKNDLIRLDTALGLLDNLKRAIKNQDASFLELRRGFKVKRVPDVIEVAESKQFANKKAILWKTVKDDLWEIHHGTYNNGEPPCIIVLGGAAGTGKTQTSWLSCFYTRTLLSMMWSPHLEFGMDEGSWMVFVIQGLTESNAEESVYDKIKYAIDQSPWFRENCPRRADYNQELQWPDQRIKISPLTGEVDASKSKDVFWAMATEMNSMRVYTKSKRLQNTDKKVWHVAREMFDNIMNRIETRFGELGGNFPGKFIVDSQREYLGDFVDEMKKRAETDKRIWVKERTLWEAQAHKYPKSEKRFLVEIGDEQRPSRIVASRDIAIDPQSVREVPERHRQRFENDCEKACKDFMGIPPTSTGRFIPYPEKITLAQTKYVEMMGDLRPFKYQEISPRTLFGELKKGEAYDWKLLLNYEYFDKILDKSTPFTIHVDMSSTTDRTGFAFTRIIGAQTVTNAHYWDKAHGVVKEYSLLEAPVYMVDGILAATAQPGEVLDPGFFEALGLELKRMLNIKYGSSDWMEAQQMLWTWRRSEILAEPYSVDKKPDGYFEYKHALRDERIIMMPHQINDHETRRLQKTLLLGKTKIVHVEGECLSGDTKIPLLNGTEQTLASLAETTLPDKPIYLYTVRNGNVSVGVGINPRKTRRDAETLIVTLDNDQEICCTPDHRFMLRSGEFIEARNLRPNDSLMPLYRVFSAKGLKGYEMVKSLEKRGHHYTHQLVAKWKYGLSKFPRGHVIHHEKGPKNNDPTKLVLVTRDEHVRIHHKTQSGMSTPERMERRRKTLLEYWRQIKNGERPESEERLNKLRQQAQHFEHGIRRRKDLTLDKIILTAGNCWTQTELIGQLNCSENGFKRALKYHGVDISKVPEWLKSNKGATSGRLIIRRQKRLADPDANEATREKFRKIKEYTQSERGRELSRRNMKRLQKDPEFVAAMKKSSSEIGKKTIRYAIAAAADAKRIELTRETIFEAARISHSREDVAKIIGVNPGIITSNLKRLGITKHEFYSWMPSVSTYIKNRRDDITLERIMGTLHYVTSLKAMCNTLNCTEKVIARVLHEHSLSRKFIQQELRQQAPNNHKVKSIRSGPVQDMYDITVLETENFAVSAGVFVHNSKDASDSVAGCLGVLSLIEAQQYYKVLENPEDEKDTESPFFSMDEEEDDSRVIYRQRSNVITRGGRGRRVG